jgi:hypothetical protein
MVRALNNLTRPVTVPHFRSIPFSYPGAIDQPRIVIRLGNHEFSGDDVGSIADQFGSQSSGRLVLLLTEKKPMRRTGIPQPQGSGTIADILRTLPRRGLTSHSEWIKSHTNQGSEAGSRASFLSPVRSFQRARAGGAGGSDGAVGPRPHGNSSDDGDENGGDNEADDSHQSSFWRRFAGIVWNVVQRMGSSF